MQFRKSSPMSAGVRSPNEICVDPSKPIGPSGTFEFINSHTMLLRLAEGDNVVLFISKGHTYAEVKPLHDPLSAALKACAGDEGSGTEDARTEAPCDAQTTTPGDPLACDNTTPESGALDYLP